MTQSTQFATGKINVELFPCAGGMAEGFRRAGVRFHIAIEWMSDHCDSYEKNLGHRPIQMDARDFLRMLEEGMRLDVALLVGDPPCTPWSHAGKRKGTDDERDMLVDTCRIIQLLQPDAYLIGNVPGLDDKKNLSIVQEHIGGLVRHGYCTADFTKLNAADYGVPQMRVRPFWFGHRPETPCIVWPDPTHGDPKTVTTDQLLLACIAPLKPWVTCWDALKHLSDEERGRPVRVRKRDVNAPFPPSDPEEPAKTLRGKGTAYITVNDENHVMSSPDKPARTLTKNTHGDGSVIVFNEKHPNAVASKPAPTLGAKQRGQGAQVIQYSEDMYSPSKSERPSKTVTASAGGGSPRTIILNEKHRPVAHDEPAPTLRGGGEGHSAPQVIMLAPNHAGSEHDKPAKTVPAGDGGGSRRVVGIPQCDRVGDHNEPSKTQTAKEKRVGVGADATISWPWLDRPSTTVQADERIAPPGHHDENFATRSLPNAIVISEKAGAILQGFPEDWVFVGKSKKARWSQIGQAMPPGLAEPVARAVVRQMGARAVVEEVDNVVPIQRSSKKRKGKE